MKLKRMFLIKLLVSSSVFLMVAMSIAGQQQGLPILQGFTSEKSTQISVVVAKGTSISLQLRDLTTGVQVPEAWNHVEQRDFSPWQVVVAQFNGLDSDRDYQLEVFDTLKNRLDSRLLRTLKLNNSSSRIALLSCVNDFLYWSPNWKRLETEKPDAVFMIGDNVYANHSSAFKQVDADEAHLWGRYVHTFQKVRFYRMKKLIPTFAIWDDHDYGQNNGDWTFPLKSQVRTLFSAFFARINQPDWKMDHIEFGPSLATKLEAFGIDFYFLDDRWYKAKTKQNGVVGLFGDEQEDWLFRNLASGDQKRPVWLISGMQYFYEYKKRGEGYLKLFPDDFWSFMGRIKASGRKVIFLSGDIHFSDYLKIEPAILGYETREVTASAMHSDSVPGMELVVKNHRRIKATAVWNFVLVDSKLPGSQGGADRVSYDFSTMGSFPFPILKHHFDQGL